MRKLFWITALVSLVALGLASPSDAWRKGSSDREDPIVADGLTLSTYLTSGSGNNIDYTATNPLSNAFTTTSGSPTVTVSHTAHGKSVGNAVSFYNTSATVGGLNMDSAWTIASVPNANSYTFTHTSNASASEGPTGTTIVTYPTQSDDGKLRFFCQFSHLNYDDPILFPGVQSATHLHLFFGNTLTDYSSTYASLRNSGDGTCDGGPLNRTAYWMPAMIDSSVSKVRIPAYFEWYYQNPRRSLISLTSPVCSTTGNLQDGRAAACPQYPIKKIERGMRAVFGYKTSVAGYPSTYVGAHSDILSGAWKCMNTSEVTQGGTYRYLHHRSTPSLGLSSNASCPSDGYVVLRFGAPNCWNGSHTGTDGYDHFATAGNDGQGNIHCPATHPYRFISFEVIVTWSYTGGIAQLANWHLSSDRHNGADFEAGTTAHTDSFWAWNDTIQAHFHQNVHAMYPASANSTPIGGPYLYSTVGTGSYTSGVVGADDWTGGPFLRNTNNGGLSGNATIGDCDAMGVAGKCRLKDHTTLGFTWLTDQLVDIPAP